MNNLAVRLADVGQVQESEFVWAQMAGDLPAGAHRAWEILTAAWAWTNAPTFKAEAAHLTKHPILLDHDSHPYLVAVLRYQSLEEAERYLGILCRVRKIGIDAAYAELQELRSADS